MYCFRVVKPVIMSAGSSEGKDRGTTKSSVLLDTAILNIIYKYTENITIYKDRYQVIWCVHHKKEKKNGKHSASLFHAHIMINSVSYADGKMYSGNMSEIYKFREHIKKLQEINTGILKRYHKGMIISIKH